jgi:hypothetical protein
MCVSVATGMCVYQTVVQKRCIPCFHGNVLSKALPNRWSFSGVMSQYFVSSSNFLYYFAIKKLYKILFQFHADYGCSVLIQTKQSNLITLNTKFCWRYGQTNTCSLLCSFYIFHTDTAHRYSCTEVTD